MSDNLLQFISTDPQFQPASDSAEHARTLLETFTLRLNLLVQGESAAYIGKSQEIPIGRMDNGAVRERQRRDLRVGDQVAGGPAGRFEQRNHLLHVIGGRLQYLADAPCQPRVQLKSIGYCTFLRRLF